jgi:NAD-dependent SIR2 family protein deacetylase
MTRSVQSVVHIAPVTQLHRSALPDIDEALRVLSGRSFAVLTGAGISTDSGIPDYRGEGAPKNHPMSLNEFVDLHGRLDKVRCLSCGQSFSRRSIADQIDRLNPEFSQRFDSSQIMPDGDVTVATDEDFRVPECDLCGGMLKPEVVFFGEFVPSSVFHMAASMLERSDALVVAGSSLVVNTGMRLVAQAQKRRKPVIVINRGPTKADQLATVRIEAGTSEALVAISEAVRVSVA